MSRILEEMSGFGIRPETTLFMQAQAGSAESLNELMEEHEGLVPWSSGANGCSLWSLKKHCKPDAEG